MAILETTLLFDVTPAPVEDGTFATLLFSVRPTTTNPHHLLFDVTQVVGAFDQLQPVGGVRQHVTPKITYSIRGTDHEIHLADLAIAEDVVLELTPDGSSWAWSFEDQALASTRDVWVAPVIGWPVEWGTVAPGKNPVAFEISYLTEGLEAMTYELMAEGLTKSNSSDALHLSCKGVGAEGRWDAARITLFLDPELGLTHGELIRLILEGAKDPDSGALVIAPSQILFGKEIGTPLNNPVDLSCANAWDEARRVGDQAGFAIVAGVAGDLTATVVALPKADILSSSKFSLEEGDFLVAGFQIDEINADHPTCIVVTSNAVDTTNADGSVTSKVIELVFDNFAVDGAFFLQDSDSLDAISVPGPPGPPFLQLKTRKTTATTVRDGCPERVEVTFEGYFNPIAARYQVAGGAPSPDLSFIRAIGAVVWIKDPDAVDFDSATAYAFRYDQFAVINYTVTHLAGPSAAAPHSGRLPQWVMDAVFPGQSEDFTFTAPGAGVETTLVDLPFAIRGVELGRQRHELTFEGGWLNPQQALKIRANESTAWETVDYVSSKLTAKLDGVQNNIELFYADIPSDGSHPIFNLALGLVVLPNLPTFPPQDRWLKVALVAREFTLEGIADSTVEGGYLTRDFVADRQWGRLGGSTHLYGDGTESSALVDDPLWRPVAKETRYSAESNVGPLTETQDQFEIGGERSRDFPKVVISPGYLPAMPLCNRNLISRENLVPLRVKVCLAPAEDVFVGREQEISVRYIETEEGLEEYAIRLLRELTALTVRGSIPIDARLRPWMPGVFDFVRRGYTARRCWVGNITIPSTQTSRGIETIMRIVLKVPVL